MNKNTKIKIFVSCHKPSYVPKNELLYPIQVGTVFAKKELEDMLHDNTGENISEKNKSYCELTAQYWAWKNIDADFYGFFHYRRYFNFSYQSFLEDGWGSIIYENISKKAIEELELNEKVMTRLITHYDIIVPKKRTLYREDNDGKRKKISVYDQYILSNSQKKEDLDIMIDILLERYPEFQQDVATYLRGTEAYECNMYIMKKQLFKEYAGWLFEILEETEKRISFKNYNVEDTRVIGFLAERLFGIYYTHITRIKELKTYEVQKTMFLNTDAEEKLNPVFTKNVIPIVMSANEQFVPYLATFIKSILENKNAAYQYDLIVLHQNISEKNEKVMQNMMKNNKNVKLRFYNVKPFLKGRKLFVDQHLSVETYFRLIIPEIMPEYSKVLYLDCDMVVNSDLVELYHTDLTGYYLAAAKDIDYLGSAKLYEDVKNYARKVLKLKSEFDYFQAGVLVMNLEEFRKNFTAKQLLEVAGSYDWRHHDQDVLNYICRQKVRYLDQRWNVVMNWQENERSRMQILRCAPLEDFQEYSKGREKPEIIHFAGYQKPWAYTNCDFSEEFWKYARNTPYYEVILQKGIKANHTTEQNGNGQNNLQVQLTGNGSYIRVNGVEQDIYLDGAYIKIINKLNRIFPIGSRRRAFFRKIGNLLAK